MSYESPTSWNDVDAGGNALDWSTRKGKLLYPAYEMLRRALVERYNKANALPLTGPLTDPIARNSQITYQWKSLFDRELNGMISKYVNHLYDELNADPSTRAMWTKDLLLKAISTDPDNPVEWIEPTYLFLGDWELQMYKILNLLKHLRFYVGAHNTAYNPDFIFNNPKTIQCVIMATDVAWDPGFRSSWNRYASNDYQGGGLFLTQDAGGIDNPATPIFPTSLPGHTSTGFTTSALALDYAAGKKITETIPEGDIYGYVNDNPTYDNVGGGFYAFIPTDGSSLNDFPFKDW